MTKKADVTPVLNKMNREKAKPLGERPHDMSAKDVHELFFSDTVFSDDHSTRK